MKYIKNLFSFIMLFSVLMLSSCNQDQEGPRYTSENVGLSFTFDSFEMSAPATDPVLSVSVYRSNSDAEYTAPVTVAVEDKKGNPVEGVTADSSVSFAAGSNEGILKVNLGDRLAVGQVVIITVALNKEDVSVGGVAKTKITAFKEYVFKSLGTGKFVDNFTSGVVYDVEIQKAEGFNRYRVMDPYQGSLKNDDGDWGNWIAINSRCPYIEFWEVDGGLLLFNAFATGINYEGSGSQAILAVHPSQLGEKVVQFNKRLDEKTFQLAPYYFVEALSGGFAMHTMDEVILIQLP